MKKLEIKGKMRVKCSFFFVCTFNSFFLLNLHPINK